MTHIPLSAVRALEARRPGSVVQPVPSGACRIFVPGKLVNPLNNRRGWKAVWRSSKTWRERVALFARFDLGHVDPKTPKRITFIGHVGGKWDDEGIVAACKGPKDGLGPPLRTIRRGKAVLGAGALIIHSDAPDSGHVFVYRQIVDRRNPGLEIIVEPIS